MTDVQHLAAIASASDDAPRLAWAEALRGRDDARAELITLQCREAALPTSAVAERAPLLEQIRALLKGGRAAWSASRTCARPARPSRAW